MSEGRFKNLDVYPFCSPCFSRDYDDLYELVAREPRVRIGNKLEHLNNGIGAVNGAVGLYKSLKG